MPRDVNFNPKPDQKTDTFGSTLNTDILIYLVTI